MIDVIDGILEEIDFISDDRTSWWEVTDALFNAGFTLLKLYLRSVTHRL